ncbi:MAG TPA: Asp-tRNA(Asn)/Glu-tRNA(Gln) amidotransferase subunit GatA [Niabella sp.]|nr:Asp-tRNA(Asn)/Glu-tRNA(Gln) amidotransferase subunit GatA [Niabella sp.]HQW14109.1 Asp-tRNA(Asn)/Glu-tRNA(Gln) amidotransferase subunit GatA [Niabella sp.]HQX19348.1 Asp-tRNA(Asn)/Glu-tRNA(Gln) amidotransferase subunit GatA [Niabella sp.]HQX41794.1 Asp-tRNA(Asn)/Glu-tRNA(Gln) amidotransferase subunit GatA [Niabella sp.]HRB05565.1 Asp-tRNA(Asn)/Glu-tRNA(Gln) amidotransferase subunit GatA [Niabella sp.]
MQDYISIAEYHQNLKDAKTSCLETVEYFLNLIDQNSHLNAFVEVFAEEAKQRAMELDLRSQFQGKLHGVVVGLKDVICFKGHSVTAASKILNGFSSVFSATVVENLIAEGAIIIGRLNCDEFAMGSTNENSFYGKVLNAKDQTRVPGGSSGGSAVAVQAGLCMVSLGSDTGGSVRQPADFCGIIGLKPTYGRVSRYGLIAYASSFDQIGVFSNNIPDAALVLEVIAGADDFDSTVSHKPVPAYSQQLDRSNKKYRIAYFPEALDHPGLDKEISNTIKSKLDSWKSDGHTVSEVHFDLLEYIVPAYYVLTTAEATSNLSRYDGVKYGYRTPGQLEDLESFYKKNRSEAFGWEVKRRIMLGNFVLSSGYFDAYFTQAQKVRRILTKKLSLIFNEFDFICLPTAPTVAFKAGEKLKDPVAMYIADIYTVMANLTGVPGISIPLFHHLDHNMPFGLQLLAAHFDELSLLSFSHNNLAE